MHLLFSLIASAIITGTPLPPWQEGCLDIHAINSARGECTFIILPDGTSMIVDAGEFVDYKPSKFNRVPPKPDGNTRPVEVYSRYIQHFLPPVCKGRLDYAIVTHYHNDHIGQIEKWMEPDPVRGYELTGIAGVEANIPFRTLIDRAWPKFNEVQLPSSSKGSGFYPKFVEYACKHDGMKAEAMKVGSRRQIRLRHHACRYPNLVVRNYAASGVVWDGKKNSYVYEGKQIRENGASCCFLISYGKFDYYTGGDAGGNSLVALPVAKAIGRPIEAMKADHHLSYHTMKDETMAILQPQVVVTQSFYERDIQPDIETLGRLIDSGTVYPGPKHFYFTNIGPEQRRAHKELYDKSAGMNGHIVIRVMPGGSEFYVYLLDDTDFEYQVLQVDGPFKCK